jgi:hypothetical protein
MNRATSHCGYRSAEATTRPRARVPHAAAASALRFGKDGVEKCATDVCIDFDQARTRWRYVKIIDPQRPD